MTNNSVPFSVLDLAPIPEGSSAKEAFSHSLASQKSAVITATGWRNITT